VSGDITADNKDSEFGRGDSPSVEQIVRAALYKEMKGYDYRELEYAQIDSRICEQFVKINPERPYSFQMYHKYISRIKPESLSRLMVEINKIGIVEGIEDLKQFREDSTVVETNIHYPTNNSIMFDCIKESDCLLRHLKEEIERLDYEDYVKEGKKTYFKINQPKNFGDKRENLFRKQLELFVKCINQVSNVIKKSPNMKKTLELWGFLRI